MRDALWTGAGQKPSTTLGRGGDQGVHLVDIVTVTADRALDAPSALGFRSSHSPGGLQGVVVVKVRGEIDLYTGPALRQTLQDLLPPVTTPRRAGQGVGGAASGGAGEPGPARVRAVVVDLTEVTFVDSYALGVLVHGHRLARPGDRAYAVVATLPMLHKLFEVTGLGRVLPLHPDVASALSGLHPAREDARG